MALLPLDASITLMFLHYSCPHMPPSSKFEMSEGDMLSQLSMTDLRSLLCNRTFSWVAAMARNVSSLCSYLQRKCYFLILMNVTSHEFYGKQKRILRRQGLSSTTRRMRNQGQV
jgi:hypothetical protein